MSTPKCLFDNICTMCKCIPPNNNTVVNLLDPYQIPKFTNKLPLPNPMKNQTCFSYRIEVGKSKQQMLPLYDVNGIQQIMHLQIFLDMGLMVNIHILQIR